MARKIRKAPEGWTLMYEMMVPPDGLYHYWQPTMGLHFKNGETVIGLKVFKRQPQRASKFRVGIVRLYRSKWGHPKIIKTPFTVAEIIYAPRRNEQ